jgi:hypothetical protein
MTAPTPRDRIAAAPASTDWDDLLALIIEAFASMDGVIDPPSSVHRLTPAALADKATRETVLVALRRRAAGCVFLADRGDHLYIGKLAVEPGSAGQGHRAQH